MIRGQTTVNGRLHTVDKDNEYRIINPVYVGNSVSIVGEEPAIIVILD
jgi:hypothetical protein